jgi:hypothetical protein
MVKDSSVTSNSDLHSRDDGPGMIAEFPILATNLFATDIDAS